MNYYNEIKNKLIDNEIFSKIKDYSRERHKVITYYEIGKILIEAVIKYLPILKEIALQNSLMIIDSEELNFANTLDAKLNDIIKKI